MNSRLVKTLGFKTLEFKSLIKLHHDRVKKRNEIKMITYDWDNDKIAMTIKTLKDIHKYPAKKYIKGFRYYKRKITAYSIKIDSMKLKIRPKSFQILHSVIVQARLSVDGREISFQSHRSNLDVDIDLS